MKFYGLIVIMTIFMSQNISAQTFNLETTVLDQHKNRVLFPEVYLVDAKDSLKIIPFTGDESGVVKLEDVELGNYYLEIELIGYEFYRSNLIELNKNLNLGEIVLKEEQTVSLDEVTLKAEKPGIQYKVDRQIINAESFPQANVAMDLLENVPSVNVDVEGNLKYRGDGTFKVFINGHPVANGVEKLKTIPTAQIERIEIITNPPAQYASEGTAGIIQVILKKSRLQGYSVNANAFTNSIGGINGYFSIDHKSEKSGWYINSSGGRNVWSKTDFMMDQLISEDGMDYALSTVENRKNGNTNMNIEAGFNFDIGKKNYLDVAMHINPFKGKSFNESYGTVVSQTFDENGIELATQSYDLTSNRIDFLQYYGGTVNFEHYFKEDKSHKLVFYTSGSYFLTPYTEEQIDQKIYESSIERLGYRGMEKRELFLDSKLTYDLPISEKSSFEIGAEMDIHTIPEIGNNNGTFDENGTLTPYPSQRSEQSIDFRQNVYSGFATFKSGFGKWEYQLGLRLENTDTKADYRYVDENGDRRFDPMKNNFTRLFPSLHVLYNLGEKNQLVANFSRRIFRPSYWQFVPFQKYNNITSYFRGNAEINPAYTNAYELAFKQNWTAKNFLSLQIFYRHSTDVINHIRQAEESEMIVSMPENVGESFSTGAEFMANFKLTNFWETNFSTSMYNYQLNVKLEQESYKVELLKYELKLNNTITLPANFVVKFNLNYYSPSQGAQERTEGYLDSSASLQKTIMDEKWTFTLGGRNLFHSFRYKTHIYAENLSVMQTMEFPVYGFFKIAYRFDNQN